MTKQIGIRIDEGNITELTDLATALGVTKSAIINLLLSSWLSANEELVDRIIMGERNPNILRELSRSYSPGINERDDLGPDTEDIIIMTPRVINGEETIYDITTV